MEEIWKEIKGYDGHYFVSDLGRIKSFKKNKAIILKACKNTDGYLHVRLSKDGKFKTFRVHRLVAIAFIKNNLKKETVNHINGIKDDNRLENLEWNTRSENMQHAVDTGLKKKVYMKGEKNGSSKLKTEDILFIRKNYKPFDENFSRKKLAEKFKVTVSCIAIIVSGKRWKHLENTLKE